jgi:3-oxoadipate enol-lactonase
LTADPVEHASEIRQTALAWSEVGAGPVVIAAHGLTQSRRAEGDSGLFDWAPVARRGRRLVRYDARGHGHSSGSPVPSDYRWDNLAADLLALIDEICPDRPVAGIGASMGTGTLLHAATRAPDRFDRLVLTSPPTAWSTRAAQGAMYHQAADLVEAQGPGALQELAAQAPVPAVFARLPAFPPPPDVTAALLPSVLRGAAESDLPPPESVSALRMPVLILAWAGDPGHPVETGQRLAELIVDARLHVAHTGDELAAWGDLAAEFLAV